MSVITDQEKTILGNILTLTFDVDEFFNNLKKKYNFEICKVKEFTEDNNDSIRKALHDYVIALSEEYCHISNINNKVENDVDLYGVFDAIKLYEKNIGKYEMEDEIKDNYIKIYIFMINIWWDIYHKDIFKCLGYDSDSDSYSESDAENNEL